MDLTTSLALIILLSAISLSVGYQQSHGRFPVYLRTPESSIHHHVFPAFQPTGNWRQPQIIEQPKDILVVSRNDPATLNCKADGFPLPTIEWYKDGLKVQSTSTRLILPTGSLFFLYLPHKAKDPDTGTYWCIARNEVGTTRSHNVTIKIACKYYFRFIVAPLRRPTHSLSHLLTLSLSH